MSEIPTASTSKKDDEENNENGDDRGRLFECNICLETAKDAVVSLCGHLFCWPCLHQWLETRPHRQLCPVCKAGISKEKVVPLYGRGNGSQQDPRTKVPPRPQGQRAEPENNSNGFPGFSFGEGGFHLSFGIGAFPFGLLTSSFNFGDPRPAVPRNLIRPEDDAFISRAFNVMAFIFLGWLFYA